MTKATDHERRAAGTGEPELPRWQSDRIARAERLAFLKEITAGNLHRMRWFILIYLPITLSIFFYNRLATGAEAVDLWSLVDAAVAFVFLAMIFMVQQRNAALPWKRALVLGYYIYCLVAMTGYYFIVYSSYGETQSYTLGVLMVAILFRLPPREFLALLITNQLVFSALLATLARDENRLFGSMLAGLDAFLLGCLAAHFLFSKEWQDFQKGRLLAKRNLEMAEANTQLRKRNEEMNEVMTIAAHDLRSPLTAMKGLFGLLDTDAKWQRKPYRRVLGECGKTCEEMLSLIKRLLDAHAAEHEHGSLCIQQIEAKSLLGNSVKKYLMWTQIRSIRLETLFPGEDIQIATDPGALEQAIDNLLSNAVKFSPSGSSIKVALFESRDSCHIEISDEGPGIPKEEHGRLFEKFRKGKTPPLDGTSGAGLGLFIVRQVMENLGGTVVFEPRLPHGALFRLTLPRNRPY